MAGKVCSSGAIVAITGSQLGNQTSYSCAAVR
jgi:hypothetical protein